MQQLKWMNQNIYILVELYVSIWKYLKNMLGEKKQVAQYSTYIQYETT